LVCLVVGVSLAQNPTGAIVGIVTDPSGSPIAGAPVTVRNADTGLERQVRTEAAGEFRAPLLPAGFYEVTTARPALRLPFDRD
jgi:hypothetical protein